MSKDNQYYNDKYEQLPESLRHRLMYGEWSTVRESSQEIIARQREQIIGLRTEREELQGVINGLSAQKENLETDLQYAQDQLLVALNAIKILKGMIEP